MYRLKEIHTAEQKFPSPAEMAYMAYSGQYEKVYRIFKSLPEADKFRYTDKNILNQAIWGGIEKLREIKKIYADDILLKEKYFIDSTIRSFIKQSIQDNYYPKELFQSILYWTEELILLGYLDESLALLAETESYGVSRFPEIQIDRLHKMARIYIHKGMMNDAYDILAHLAERPYLISDRKMIPQILFNLSQITLVAGNAYIYKKLLLLGLRHFYTGKEDRRNFVDQLRKTYRHSYRLLLSPDLKWPDKFLYAIHLTCYKVPDFRKIRLGFINRFAETAVLLYVYAMNYLKRAEPVNFKARLGELTESTWPVIIDFNKPQLKNRKKILVTRAMGGIGDLLMMTPGLHALSKKYPDHQIHFAVPKRYFPLFEGNKDIFLKDIEEKTLNHLQYKKWYNFTDCPASRVESKTAPKVKKSRIDIFARALGIRGFRFIAMDRKPRYFVHEEEHLFKNKFWQKHNLAGKKVIGIQLHSDETYRNYPHMKELVSVLAKDYSVLVFDGEQIKGYNFENVIKVDNCSLRNAFALANGCDALIAPDSSFVHFAASRDIPCIGLFGPIDGKVRTKHYEYCSFLDASDQIDCLPCWRNESIPCRLTNMRGSVCMSKIQVNRIISELNKIISKKDKNEKPQ